MNKKLYSFDFDDTLFLTPKPELGKKIYKEKTGKEWKSDIWWTKSESLNTEIFKIDRNDWVYEKYLEATTDENSIIIMSTGRLNKAPMMRENVCKILRENNLNFDEVMIISGNDKYPSNGKDGIYLNWGGDIFKYKVTLFEKLIKITECDHFIMYDDRYDHIVRFKEWAKKQDLKITVVDVVNKKERTFN